MPAYLIIFAFLFTTGIGAEEASQPVIALERLDRMSGKPGETVVLHGRWGAAPGELWPVLGPRPEYHLEVISGTETELTVRLPKNILPGNYQLAVYLHDPHNASKGRAFRTEYQAFRMEWMAIIPWLGGLISEGLGEVEDRASHRRARGWLIGTALFGAVFFLIMAGSARPRKGDGSGSIRFPRRTDRLAPFLGKIGWGRSLEVVSTDDLVEFRTSTTLRRWVLLAAGLAGPALTTAVILNAKEFRFLRHGLTLVGMTGFSGLGWAVFFRQLTERRRMELDVPTRDLRVFIRPWGKPAAILKRGTLTRFERTQEMKITGIRKGGPPLLTPYETLTAVTAEGQRWVLLGGESSDIQTCVVALKQIAPVEEVVSVRGPSGLRSRYEEWKDHYQGTAYEVRSLGSRDWEPIITVWITLPEVLKNRLMVRSSGDFPADPGDPRRPHLQALLDLGAEMVDVSQLTARVAAGFPWRRRVIDRSIAERVVGHLIRLRDLSG